MTSSAQRTILVTAAFAVGAGLLWWVTSALPPGADTSRAALAQTASRVPDDQSNQKLRAEPGSAAPRSAATVPGATADAPPPGVTPAQWAAVVAEHATQPDGPAELARLRAYLGWSDAVARWRAAPGDPALAQTVYDGLPARLAQREVSVPEARVLAAALLQTLEADAQRQQQALQAFERMLPGPSAADPRQQAYLRAQAAEVAAWRAAPAASRDPAVLQARLDQLRVQHFAHHGATSASPDTPPEEASR
ncbi:hypothetical protein [Rubrivivax albus]|uniref:Uncharacterized protein n=1 Tax=Rubrivivax albus TaxID=2499835 RepID=A0A3S2TSH9_9BURK|nr:hypothetical protein [Rubrivivax albus]RVT53574.1 hypothetical protein ENE75_01340 [Rubrivivax albus]